MKACRWELARDNEQTTVLLVGAAGSDHARELTGLLSKAVRLPDRASLVDQDGQILIAFPGVIPEELSARIRRWAEAAHGNAKRPTLDCTITTEEVTGDALARFVRGQRTVMGERRHLAWNLRGPSFKELADDDYAFGPIRPLEEEEERPDADEISAAVRMSRRRWKRIHSDPVRRELVRYEERELQAGAWCKDQTIVTYQGPPKLLREYAEYKGGQRNYEAAFDHVAAMLGDDPPEPYRLPSELPVDAVFLTTRRPGASAAVPTAGVNDAEVETSQDQD